MRMNEARSHEQAATNDRGLDLYLYLCLGRCAMGNRTKSEARC